MEIRFWGVRGSVSVSGVRYARTGGNTSCVEVTHEGERLILDGGTGLASLGETIAGPANATIVFSHVHWDHIQGLPFFGPAYHPASRLRLVGRRGLRDALDALMRPPTFPVGLSALRVAIDETEGPLEIGPFRLRALPQNHPDGVLAWRVEAGGRALVYATDIEHAGTIDARLVAFAEGADLLVHDAQYTEAEAPTKRGWGHSTWGEAVEVARRAGAARLALFHHDPRRDDDSVAVFEHAARATLAGAFAAREGARVAL